MKELKELLEDILERIEAIEEKVEAVEAKVETVEDRIINQIIKSENNLSSDILTYSYSGY